MVRLIHKAVIMRSLTFLLLTFYAMFVYYLVYY
jgi:hypothetical protein